MNRVLLITFAAAVLLVSTACGSTGSTSTTNPRSRPLSSLGHLQRAPYHGDVGAELVPIPAAPALVPAASKATLTTSVDGIKCQQNELLISHEHAHLTLFVNGQPRRIPAGVGIWPPINAHNYFNGQFGITEGNCPERGAVTAIVNGRVWTGDPRQIPLKRHAQIQLEVGKPLIAPQAITFPGRY